MQPPDPCVDIEVSTSSAGRQHPVVFERRTKQGTWRIQSARGNTGPATVTFSEGDDVIFARRQSEIFADMDEVWLRFAVSGSTLGLLGLDRPSTQGVLAVLTADGRMETSPAFEVRGHQVDLVAEEGEGTFIVYDEGKVSWFD